MKTIITFLFILVLGFSVFGQIKRPMRRPVKPTADKPKTAAGKIAVPKQQVTVKKTDGETVVGLFLSGDTEFVVVQVGDAVLPIKISEINRLTFGINAASDVPPRAGIATRIGTTDSNADSISGGVLNGKAVSLIKPEYPAAARAVRASGAVNVQVTIDEQGNISSAAAVSGHPLLRQAAEQAARGSTFAPTTLEGQPVSVTGIIVYNFVP